ncbi:hypothetical protein ACO2Q1_06640 [Brevundimonas sp. VNH65]|uniref:hypothetical protein n=1 Tax=Brevundimonas sp. VNH65 TaxID=3400917 RepID=UPI000A3A3F8C|nr:hypothetical protein [Novosphingobium panipatense]
MDNNGSSFSERFNYSAPDAEITVREDAPKILRAGLTQLAYAAEIGGNPRPGSRHDLDPLE